jgi:adenylate cyclase
MRIRRPRTSLRRSAVVLAIAVLTSVSLAELRILDPAFVQAVRERTLDTYQRYRPREYRDLPVRVVDIDERSLALYGQWPWPRTRVAELTRRLVDLGASVVCYDVLFAEPDRSSPQRFVSEIEYADPREAEQVQALVSRLPDHDQIFARALHEAPSVLGFAAIPGARADWPPVRAGLAFAGTDPKTILPPMQGAAGSLPLLNDAARGIGGISLNAGETSGVVRRIPMLFSNGTHLYPSLSIEALRVAFGADSILVRSTGSSGEANTGQAAIVGLRVGDLQIPLTAQGELWLYFDRNRAERYVSAADVLDPAKADEIREKLEGQVAFVGTSAVGLLDNRVSPLGEEIPGVAIHAQAVEQVLSGNFLSRPDWADGLEIGLTVVLGVGIALLLLVLGAQYTFVIGGLATAATLLGAWLAFTRAGLLFDPIFPAASGLAVYLGTTGLLYIFTDRERRFVRQAFGQYLAPELLEQLERSPDVMRLGGEVRELSIMFMDVRDFTPLSERLTAPELIHFLNQLFSPLSDAICAELGTIDKYIGDSIMAFWNAPVAVPDHPARACRAGLKMVEAVRKLSAEDAFGFRANGYDDLKVRIGIGINTGEACVGNMGSERRFNYSVVGDAVNTAARLESSCKAVGAELLISEPTAALVPDFAMLEVGEVPLKGKARPAKVFALLGDESFAKSPTFQDLARRHAVLIEAIAARSVANARAALERCRELAPDLQIYASLEGKVSALETAEPFAKAS